MIKASSFNRCRTSGTGFGKHGYSAKTLVSIIFITLAGSSCVTPSPPGEVAVASVQEVQEGKADTGLPLRWGGTITSVRNKKEVTVLEIVSRPLSRSGRPRHNDRTDGRFLAEINGFLDPAIVSPGRDISVVGIVVRLDDGQVGEAEYQYPVISVFNYRFWKKPSEIDPNSGYPHYFPHDRFWHDWPRRRGSRVSGRLVF